MVKPNTTYVTQKSFSWYGHVMRKYEKIPGGSNEVDGLFVVVVVVVVDILYLQQMISYRKYVIKMEALERNHTGVVFLFP